MSEQGQTESANGDASRNAPAGTEGEPRATSHPLPGLDREEAIRRLATHGPNRFSQTSKWQRVKEWIEPFTDPMAVMLGIAATMYLLLGETSDGVILLIALVPVLGIDVVLERRSHKALSQLAKAVAPRARVVRGGVEEDVPSEDLVPGDVVILREGHVIHADGVVRVASNMTMDESALTGESEPQEKNAAHEGGDPAASRFFAGATMLSGHGYGEITATGPRTQFGAIARLLAESADEPSPLQKQTLRLVRVVGFAALGIAAIVFAIALLRGAVLRQALLSAVSLAMASVPEEFPLVFTLFLTLGAFRLGRKGVLVRKLASVETLGSTTVICTDKTGTLTFGRFDLDEHISIGHPPADAPDSRDRNGPPSDEELLEIAALACEPHASDPMERAIAAHCVAHGTAVDAIHAQWELVRDHPFDPHGKHMSHVWRRRDDPQRWRVVAKGALEGILEHCAEDADVHAQVEGAHTDMAARGLRLLAVACHAFRGDASANTRDDDERDLHLVGLLGFRDPLRPEVPAAVRDCMAAGIKIKIVTGDHGLTAHAIATAAGIPIGEHGVVKGDEIDALSDGDRDRRIREATVFARVRPEQKYGIVDALCRGGDVVAMTGDGINDAPALRRADIGVAMGKRGTDVARGAADMTLLEDDFASIVATVREGRRIFANIQRAFLYLIAFHIPIVALALLVPIVGRPLLLLPVHLVWLELIVHPVSALVFEGEQPPVDVMRLPPRRPGAPLLSPRRVMRSAITGVLLTAAVFGVYLWRIPEGDHAARAAAIVTLIVGCVLLAFAEREGDRPWFRAGQHLGARFVWINLAVLATLPIAIQLPVVARVFHVAPIGLLDWVTSTVLAIVAVGWRALGATRRQRIESKPA